MKNILQTSICDGLAFPAQFQNAKLYAGKYFINEPDTCSAAQKTAGANTGVYPCGKPSTDFVAAMLRLHQINAGKVDGGVGYSVPNKSSIAEWKLNEYYYSQSTFESTKDAGDLITTGFLKDFGKFYGRMENGQKISVERVGYASFIFAMFGLAMDTQSFKDCLDEWLAIPEDEISGPSDVQATLQQKLICRAAAEFTEWLTAEQITAVPVTANVTSINDNLVRSQKFAPDTVIGKLSFVGRRKKATSVTAKAFAGMFKRQDRALTEEEKAMVPDIADCVIDDEIVNVDRMIAFTRDTKRPFTNIMLRGDPSVGKTAGSRAIAAGLGLPYTFVTCNAGTEISDLIGSILPVSNDEDAAEVNAEMFAELPSASDISIDPATCYQALTGKEKEDATEGECLVELFKKFSERFANKNTAGQFRYIESPLVQAIRYGWVCEIQEPSLIQRPAVMPGLNGLLDETNRITLPTGEMLTRHPDCVIISTLNVDLEGCRPLNQAFLDRHHMVVDMKSPDKKIIEKRVQSMTGVDTSNMNVAMMIDTLEQMSRRAKDMGETSGNRNSIRQLANWVLGVDATGEYLDSAKWSVISGITADPDLQDDLIRIVQNRAF